MTPSTIRKAQARMWSAMTRSEGSARSVMPVSRAAALDQRLEQVDLVVAVHVLQHRGQPLQAHAGVDAGLGQRRERAGGVALELHEHQVPDLDVAVAVLLGAAGRPALDLGTVVVEDLGARAAGAGVGHLPEVVRRVARALVVADAHDALARHADLVGPDVVRFVIFGVDRDPERSGAAGRPR
jgi:hypothetical protein